MALTTSDKLFGKKAVELEFITPKQLARVIELKEKSMPDKKLGEILMAKGFISSKEVQIIVQHLKEQHQLHISKFETYFWQIKIRCHCNKKILFPGNLIGSSGRCPQCMQHALIPPYNDPSILGFICACGLKLEPQIKRCTGCQRYRPDLVTSLPSVSPPKLATAGSSQSITQDQLPSAPTVPTSRSRRAVTLADTAPSSPPVLPANASSGMLLEPITEPLRRASPVLKPQQESPKNAPKSLEKKLRQENVEKLTKRPEKRAVSASKGLLAPQESVEISMEIDETAAHTALQAMTPQPSSKPLEEEDVLEEENADRQFARICLRLGLASAHQIDEAFQQQNKSLAETGDYLKLGQILIRNGVLTVQDFLKIVSEQKKNVLECEQCHAIYQLNRFKPGSQIPCKNCGADLHIPILFKQSQGTAQAILGVGTVTSSVATATQANSGEQTLSPLGFKGEGLLGKRIDKYEILSELGRGGMGVVFKARDTALNRVVAMKVLRDGEEASQEQIRRFQKEAESMGKIRHRLIVPIYDYGMKDNLHYFTMEFVSGRTLDEYIDRRAFTQAKCVRILKDLAEAIHAAHSVGIIHRDLKPSNIIVDEEGSPHIMDFGLAKDIDNTKSRLTRTGAMIGTPYYMSPEQAKGEKRLTTAVDIYALGVILYEMLTGRVPFSGQNQAEVYHKIIHKSFRPIRELNPKISPELEIICSRLMMKAPVDRYQTAQDISEDLQRFMEHRPIQAKKDSIFSKTYRVLRNHGTLIAILVAVLFFLVLGIYHLIQFLAEQTAEEEVKRFSQKYTDTLKGQEKQEEETQKRLAKMRQNVDAIVAQLRLIPPHGKPEEKLRDRLIQLSSTEEVDYLATFLKDPDIRLRTMIASAFRRIQNPRACEHTLEALKIATNTDEIETYMSILGSSSYQPAIAEIVKHLEHPKQKVRDIAISAMSLINADRTYTPKLLEKLKDPHSDTRIKALIIQVILEKYRFPEVEETIQSFIHDSNEMVRVMAIKAVGELKIRSAVPSLCQFVQLDSSPAIREISITALGQIKDRQAVEVLRSVLDSRNLFLVLDATKALQGLKEYISAREIEDLRRMQEDKEEKVALIKNYLAQVPSLRSQGRFQEALELCNQALEMSPYEKTYFERGVTYGALGDFQRAFADLNQAQKYHPTYVLPRVERANLNGKKGNLHLALKDLDEALNIDPRHSAALQLRASVYNEMGQINRALEDLQTLLVFGDNEAEAYGLMAQVHFVNQDAKSALEYFEKAIQSDPNYVDTYLQRALCYLNQRNFDSAKEDLDHALRLDRRNVKALTIRADILRKQNKFEQAIADLRLALTISPSHTDAGMILGEIYEDQGEIERAIESYSQAIELGRKQAICYIKRGAALFLLKRYSEAIPDYHLALELDPKMHQPYHGLILGYSKLEDFDKAWSYVQAAQEQNIPLPGDEIIQKIRKKVKEK
jgi:serine/threonine protein kinase/tetratricopeptide (TPR) repeat protein